MATSAASRFRPDDDWTQTIISTRPSPPKEPRDERVRIARPLHGGAGAGVARKPVPVPLDVRLAQAKGSVRLVSRCEDEMLREPEIVDLASSSRPWTARREACPPYPPPPPPKSKKSLRGLPSVASRQSEMSFGILDYYIHDPSPLPSPDLPTNVKPAVDPAIERFDFGLRRESVETPEARAGAEEEMQLIPLSPRPFEEEKPEPEPQQAKKYSLFPAMKKVSPSAHRLAQVINESPHQPAESTPYRQQEPAWRPRLLSGAKLTNTPTPPRNRQRTDTISSSTQAPSPPTPTTTIPSPSYHPRNLSFSFSTTSRLPSTSISSGSGSSTRDSQRIPLRILSSSSTATATTNTTSRSSISTSPGSTILSQQKPLLSRWSEDTALASPTTAAAVLGCRERESFGSLVCGSGEYPACFFEDDEEVVPLRRRGGGRGRGKGWKGWFCCGGRG